MRTTLDLPDELLREARERARREGITLTALLADALRSRLVAEDPPAPALPLPVSSRAGGLQPGIDPNSNASLLDAADGAPA